MREVEKEFDPRITLSITTDNENDLRDYINASRNSSALWELRHNFWRKWKHVDNKSEDFMKGVWEVLDALAEELKDLDLDD